MKRKGNFSVRHSPFYRSIFSGNGLYFILQDERFRARRPGNVIIHAMTIEDIQAICRKYPGVTQDIKWGDHLCFCIAQKMFLITAPDATPSTASIKVADEEFEAIAAREGFTPAPYLARYKWVWMDDINRLSLKEWEQFIDNAYGLIASRLPLKIKKEIGLDRRLS